MSEKNAPALPTPSAVAGRAAAGVSVGLAVCLALAAGAVAIGAVAIGALAIGRVRLGKVEIDELTVRKLSLPPPED